MNFRDPRVQRTITVIIAILSIGFGITVAVTEEEVTVRVPIKAPAPPVDQSPAIPETTPVDTADKDAETDTDLQLTERAENVAQHFVDKPGDLSNAGPVPLSGTGIEKGVGEIGFPMASDEIKGCRTRFLTTNFSDRGVPPSRVIAIALHFTAGPDIPNSRAEVDGLTAFGNRAASRVSWHINMDKEAHCDYNVPLAKKAWTISNANPYTINFEVAGRGEAPYLSEAGYRKMARIIQQIRQAYPGIKLRLTGFTNCVPNRGGITTHWMGGLCSGNHSDIKPHEIRFVIRQIRKYTRKPIPKAHRRRCKEMNRLRHDGKNSPAQKKRIAELRRGFKKHDVKCVGGEVKRR